ncbi:MAG: phosphoglycerate kinase [Flavobacteriaceae bacterium]|nr:phosphoglycerate kinase [Flavobacteriaceae bacterium]
MKSISSINFKNKKALIRVDFNVPLNENQEVTDSTRIVAAKPTIIHILEQGGSCILMSHLGRPKGVQQEFSLKHIVNTVEDILGIEAKFASNCIGDEAETAASTLEPGELLILENLRFHEEEKEGNIDFARKLSNLGDIYVNDAFGTAHRAHASTTTIARFFEPDQKCFGILLSKEIEAIKKIMETGEKPVTAILGGAKVSSKISIIDNILGKIDHLIIGGGMTFTFIKALGGQIGDSLVEDDKLDMALSIIEKAKSSQVSIHLPTDVVIADKFSNEANIEIAPIDKIPSGWMGLDVGPKTNEKFAEVIARSRTILWNGPVGVFEMERFSKGTIALGQAIADATSNGSFSLVGGGDSVAAVKQFGFENKVSYVSTGGGAMLESLEGKTLPGIAAILE